MTFETLNQLWLLHLSDSALPIGTASHSFGLESMIEEGWLDVDNLSEFLCGYLSESGRLEAAFCYRAWQCDVASKDFASVWTGLNDELSAFKPAREIRLASATLGRRLLALAFEMTGREGINQALTVAAEFGVDVHHSTAFGLIAGLLHLDAGIAAAAWIHQSAACMISACQRLMPLGQNRASSILADLKPHIAGVADSIVDSHGWESGTWAFNPVLELAGMRHPVLRTRLFIS